MRIRKRLRSQFAAAPSSSASAALASAVNRAMYSAWPSPVWWRASATPRLAWSCTLGTRDDLSLVTSNPNSLSTISCVSTQSVVMSTLDPASRRPFLDKWDSVSTHSVVVPTHSD
ncbi:hypothetical protein Taro_050108 [Colocasia esculenta]|uniref:Uncharacterized protein n=1 Tax=Colocasia esculenta TaxID=4460 RepID=A0A843XD07_COLES|nr:hypothetical protein [Colocasia esculenta]